MDLWPPDEDVRWTATRPHPHATYVVVTCAATDPEGRTWSIGVHVHGVATTREAAETVRDRGAYLGDLRAIRAAHVALLPGDALGWADRLAESLLHLDDCLDQDRGLSSDPPSDEATLLASYRAWRAQHDH